ncbi:hypothetical protein ACS0TY_034923 [Phlomoides rotata]
MDILQNEVRQVARNEHEIIEEDLEKMSYLKAVIKESLRLHAPAPLLVPRVSTQDTKVLGYEIASGTHVLINTWAISRDPSFWHNSEEFIPERFLDTNIDFRGLHFEFTPFGAGRRGCPGVAFAISVAELALAKLVYNFNFALPDGAREIQHPTVFFSFPIPSISSLTMTKPNQLLHLLTGQGLIDLVDGNCPAPLIDITGADRKSVPNPAYTKWRTDDQRLVRNFPSKTGIEMDEDLLLLGLLTIYADKSTLGIWIYNLRVSQVLKVRKGKLRTVEKIRLLITIMEKQRRMDIARLISILVLGCFGGIKSLTEILEQYHSSVTKDSSPLTGGCITHLRSGTKYDGPSNPLDEEEKVQEEKEEVNEDPLEEEEEELELGKEDEEEKGMGTEMKKKKEQEKMKEKVEEEVRVPKWREAKDKKQDPKEVELDHWGVPKIGFTEVSVYLTLFFLDISADRFMFMGSEFYLH